MVVLCLVLGKSRGSSLRHVISGVYSCFFCVYVQVVVFFGFMGSIYAMRNHRKTMKELAHKNLNGIVSNRRTAGGGGATVHPLVRACFFDFSVVCCCVFTQFLFYHLTCSRLLFSSHTYRVPRKVRVLSLEPTKKAKARWTAARRRYSQMIAKERSGIAGPDKMNVLLTHHL